MSDTEKLLLRIAVALEAIADDLGDEGPIVEQLARIRSLLKEVAPAPGERPNRILRTMDMGCD